MGYSLGLVSGFRFRGVGFRGLGLRVEASCNGFGVLSAPNAYVWPLRVMISVIITLNPKP